MATAIIKAIAIGISILTTAIMSGCAVENDRVITNGVENSIYNEEISITTETTTQNTTTTTTTTAPVTAQTETTTTTTAATTTTAKPETTTTTPAPATTTTAKPATTTTTTTQAPVTTTTTTVTTTKPVETTAPAYDCKRDGHKFVMTTITSEPMWCREIHWVFDFGFDLDLANRYFPNIANPYDVYLDTLSKMGVIGDSGMATVEVEVWGTKTYDTTVCTVCGDGKDFIPNDGYTINPIGEWQYVNGVNPRMANSSFDFNTIHYDPYNIPQKVVDNISAYWKSILPF